MDFAAWLDQERGRTARIAERFGISQGAVSQWRVNGVPRDRLLAVVAMSEGALTLESLIGTPGASATPHSLEVRDAA